MSSEATLRELRKISRILILTNAVAVEKELSKIATTNERKKMWVLMDGKRMPKDLAKETGVTAMAVSNFLAAGVAAELIEYNRGEPPRRMLDYVPPSWIELVKLPVVEEKTEEPRQIKLEEISKESQIDQTKGESNA
jgi:hypothetical protein